MDANGNGILERSEIPEDRRARWFLEWTAREAKIDLKQPVPIAKLQESMHAARERMRGGGMGGGGMGGRPGGGDSNRDGGNRDGGNRDQGSGNRPEGASAGVPQPMTNKPATLVAGFGGQPAAVQARGFGSGATSQPASTPTAAAAPSPAPVNASPMSGPGGPNPRSIAEGMIKSKDKDGNLVLEKDKGEMDGLGIMLKAADANNDGRITVEEVMAKNESWANQRGSDAGSPPTTAPATPTASTLSGGTASAGGRKSYRAKTPRERLPSDIPSWFVRSDENGDGQVLMSEYATVWTTAKVSDFTRFDLNGDGVITAKECLKAERK